MSNDRQVIPKQFYHWLKSCGIRRVDRTSIGDFYFKSTTRHYRITCDGRFQVSETFNTFDRWANSVEDEHYRIPQTRKELLIFLNGEDY